MAELKLYNTLTRQKEVFDPILRDNIRMYVCGPTVYDFAHIGNARPVIVFDVLFRLLRHLAKQGVWDGGKGETRVTYARNITDVDDKINKRAFERWTKTRSLNEEIKALTVDTAAQFHADVKALGCLEPTHEPRATDYVCDAEKPLDMVRVIEKLIANGNAYAAEGHVLFNVPSMPGYGALARRPKDDMIAGARVEVAPYKRDPMDFVLWKPSDPATEPGWDSPWGFGRPGWHIECSAMSGALLGEVFDIHAGGLDLIFPHHENEIAQSCCAFGKPGQPNPLMARYWLHNGFLQVEGQKMSKSLGNFVTIRELWVSGRFGGKAWGGDVLRFAMLKTHYRQPINWSVDLLTEAEENLKYLGAVRYKFDSVGLDDVFVDTLCDDLNTKIAIDRLFELAKSAESGNSEAGGHLVSCLNLLGFFEEQPLRGASFSANEVELDGSVRSVEEQLATAMLDFFPHNAPAYWAINRLSGSDHLQQDKLLEIQKLASTASDASTVGDVFSDVTKTKSINTAITARLAARNAKNWAESDRIRDELAAMGIQLKDGKDASGNPITTWEVKR